MINKSRLGKQNLFIKRLFLGCAFASIMLILLIGPASSVDETQQYAQNIQNDPRLASTYLDYYSSLVQNGWSPVNAYHAVYAYWNGWVVGYYSGALEGAYQLDINQTNYLSDLYNYYESWLKNTPWSSGVWGMYQQGYLDGEDRGMQDGQAQKTAYVSTAAQFIVETESPNIPPPQATDFGRYKQKIDAECQDDPFCDLKYTQRFSEQGPIGGP